MTWLLSVGSAIGGLWVVMSFTYPFGWDQGLFAWVGDTVVKGGLPYRDAWDIKGPMLYYIYALAQRLFGVHLWSIRVVDLALLALTTRVVFLTMSGLVDRHAARFAAVFFFLWYASHSYWHTAQPDGWAGMLLMAAAGPLLAGSAAPNGASMARAGVYLGLATLLKPIWVAFLALPFLYVGFSRQARAPWLILAVLTGWVFPIVLMIGWFAWNGALGDLVDVHLRYSAIYAGLASDNRLKSLAEFFLSSRVIAVSLPIAAYGVVELWRKRRPAAVLLLGWLATTVILVSLQGRFYAYHWLPLLPAMTILVTIGIRDLSVRAKMFEPIICGLILVGCVAPICLEAARFVAWRVGATTRQAYYNAYGEPGADMQAVEWLRTTAASGKVFTFGWHCSVPWLSERESVSRFCYSLPLMMGEGTATQSRYRAEVLEALNADRPKYILVGEQSEQILGARLTIADFPELADLVQRAYRPVAWFGSITIHEINP